MKIDFLMSRVIKHSAAFEKQKNFVKPKYFSNTEKILYIQTGLHVLLFNVTVDLT